MKIALVHESVLPRRGGCETYVASLAHRLTADGHQVHLYARRWDEPALPPGIVYHPVEATSHSPDGLNEMTYNRCVGTRYCSNNCPYKVRRFNFLQYTDYATASLKLQHNPEVTVRTRGVMEKCTFCVQRINSARDVAVKEKRTIREGEVVTACQQVCPSNAIVFGNLRGKEEKVTVLRDDPRAYRILEHLYTRPAVSYLKSIRRVEEA